MSKPRADKTDPKMDDLEPDRRDDAGTGLTTNQGLKVTDDQNSLKAGERGASLLEDFHFREKVTPPFRLIRGS